jgi:protein-tyrosine phosphatase
LITHPFLHPLRARWVRRRLRAVPRPGSIVFVCLGNLCRSPFAEHLLRSLLGPPLDSIVIASAGFLEPGRSPPRAALTAAAARGVDLTQHRSRTFGPGSPRIRDASQHTMATPSPVLLVLMDPVHERLLARVASTEDTLLLLGDLDPVPGRPLIRDPMGQPPEVFDTVYDRIQRCVGELARVLAMQA